MTMPTNVFRAAQDLECKREAMEYAHERVKTAIKAVTDAKNKAVRANEAGADLLSALKEANLMPDPNRPTVGKEPEHDHAKS
jgi:hypothetical protein